MMPTISYKRSCDGSASKAARGRSTVSHADQTLRPDMRGRFGESGLQLPFQPCQAELLFLIQSCHKVGTAGKIIELTYSAGKNLHQIRRQWKDAPALLGSIEIECATVKARVDVIRRWADGHGEQTVHDGSVLQTLSDALDQCCKVTSLLNTETQAICPRPGQSLQTRQRIKLSFSQQTLKEYRDELRWQADAATKLYDILYAEGERQKILSRQLQLDMVVHSARSSIAGSQAGSVVTRMLLADGQAPYGEDDVLSSFMGSVYDPDSPPEHEMITDWNEVWRSGPRSRPSSPPHVSATSQDSCPTTFVATPASSTVTLPPYTLQANRSSRSSWFRRRLNTASRSSRTAKSSDSRNATDPYSSVDGVAISQPISRNYFEGAASKEAFLNYITFIVLAMVLCLAIKFAWAIRPPFPASAPPSASTAPLMDQEEPMPRHRDSLLYTAALNGATTDVERLLAEGHLPCERNADLMTPLHAAALSGNVDIVSKLLICEKTAWRAENGVTPLHLAAQHGHKAAVLKLLSLSDHNWARERAYDENAIDTMKTATKHIFDEKFQGFFARKTFTARELAAIYGHINTINLFGESFGDDLLHALSCACLVGNSNMVETIWMSNSERGWWDRSEMPAKHVRWFPAPPLHLAVMAGSRDIVAFMLEKGVSTTARYGSAGAAGPFPAYSPPAHYAATVGAVKILEALEQKGASLTALDQHVRSPLSYAVENEQSGAVEMLIKRKPKDYGPAWPEDRVRNNYLGRGHPNKLSGTPEIKRLLKKVELRP